MQPKVLVEWTGAAEGDLLLVIAKIAAENPVAADDLLDEIREKAQGLSEYPKLYAFSQRAKQYRQLTVRANFLVYYRVLTEDAPVSVKIMAVVHARQQWP